MPPSVSSIYQFGYSDMVAKISLNVLLLISAILLVMSELPIFSFPANQIRTALSASRGSASAPAPALTSALASASAPASASS